MDKAGCSREIASIEKTSFKRYVMLCYNRLSVSASSMNELIFIRARKDAMSSSARSVTHKKGHKSQIVTRHRLNMVVRPCSLLHWSLAFAKVPVYRVAGQRFNMYFWSSWGSVALRVVHEA